MFKHSSSFVVGLQLQKKIASQNGYHMPACIMYVHQYNFDTCISQLQKKLRVKMGITCQRVLCTYINITLTPAFLHLVCNHVTPHNPG